MAQSKQILRSRIKSVNNTRKITKAMEMIANAKLVKQRSRMEANREYAQRLQDTVNEIVAKNPGVECAFLGEKTSGKKAVIVFCSDLGLCGGYNQNILRAVRDNVNKDDKIMLVGTSLFRTLKEMDYQLMNEDPLSCDKASFWALRDLVEIAVEMYQNDEVGVVELIYTKFVNTMSFQASVDQLLPCELNIQPVEIKTEGHVETLFEPDAETILNQLIPMMLNNVVYADWMESTTAEQGSRRVAMKTATDNADELSYSLKLEYNKARQAAITQEITEIVGGSAAV